MGLDISMEATKGDKKIDLGRWKNNWVLIDTLELMGLVKDNEQEIEVDSYQLLMIENIIRETIGKVDLGKYKLDCELVDEVWNDTALNEGGKGWKWLFNAKVRSENDWKISIWWWW